jgi:hypothetical protein
VWEDDGRREGIGRRGPRTNHEQVFRETPKASTAQPSEMIQRHVALHLDPWRQKQFIYAGATDNEGQTARPAVVESIVPALVASSDEASAACTAHEAHGATQQSDVPAPDSQALLYMVRNFSPGLPAYPHQLEGTKLTLLGNYIQRFSRSYPTFAEPTNPFLSVLLPLAMQDSIVMDTLLVLSSAQTGRAVSPGDKREFLHLRQRALRGNRRLLAGIEAPSSSRFPPSESITLETVENLSESTVLMMLASAVMFLLYDKVSGETTWKPHIDFIGRLCTSFAQRSHSSPETAEAFQFLYNIFLYNDLIRATSLMTSTSSEFYVNAGSTGPSHILGEDSRYYFPGLIARISNGDLTVTEADIAAWDGNMYWLPSFSISPSLSFDKSRLTAEQKVLVELYKIAAVIYLHAKKARLLTTRVLWMDDSDDSADLGAMASYAIDLVARLPAGSSLENAMLWPIGIIARQLTMSQVLERAAVLDRLHDLQLRFGMRHFQRVREMLMRDWAIKDAGSDIFTGQGPTMILLG